MERALVTVVVPIYNTEKYLRRAVESICKQTYKNIEILLINDGSPDDAEKVCMKLIEEDKRIKYFYQENNGVSSARNLGIKNARGKYILFCDSDDEWKKTLLEKSIAEMQKEGIDYVRFGLESMEPRVCPSDSLTKRVMSQRELCVARFSDEAVYRNMSSSCLGVYRCDLIKNNHIIFRDDLSHGEDGIFALEYALKCNKISLLDENLYVYYPVFEGRLTATSRTQKALYNEYELLALEFELLFDEWNQKLTDEEKRVAYSQFYHRLIGRMVCFAAYSTKETEEKDIAKLGYILSKSYMLEANRYYKRVRSSDSRMLPFLMKKRWMTILWLVLKSRGRKYLKMWGKKTYIESIWKNEKISKSN